MNWEHDNLATSYFICRGWLSGRKNCSVTNSYFCCQCNVDVYCRDAMKLFFVVIFFVKAGKGFKNSSLLKPLTCHHLLHIFAREKFLSISLVLMVCYAHDTPHSIIAILIPVMVLFCFVIVNKMQALCNYIPSESSFFHYMIFFANHRRTLLMFSCRYQLRW